MNVYPFSATKFDNTALFRHYYPFGNTPAEDLLEHVPDSCKNPSVLQLGCGDIRSCFYTLWKNFDESHHGNFEGVTFHLNDYCAAVLARNVLFLYWTLVLADIPEKDTHKTKQMICSIWNIWFCHDLQRHDVVLLKKSVTKLLEFFKSDAEWATPTDPLRGLIHYVGSEFKQAICKMYTFWLQMLKDNSAETKIHLKRERAKVVEDVKRDIDFCFESKFGIYSPQFMLNESLRELMIDEYSNYLETGNANAEKAFGMPVATRPQSLQINPTLYERANLYTLESFTMPYECFVHGHLMTKKNIDFPPRTLLVQHKIFKQFPLLANSVQQFIMWLMSAAKYLSKLDVQQQQTTFIFHYSHAINTAVSLRRTHSHLFDVIHSSNLINSLTSFGVIMNTIPILRKNGVLLTTIMNWGIHKTVKKNVEATLYFKLEQLLPLFGIRCVGHEGIYAGDGTFHPIPSFRPVSEATIGIRSPCVVIWKSVNATPLFLPSLNEHSLTTKALFDCIKGATVSFLSVKPCYIAVSEGTTNSHSAMTALSIFKNHLSSESLKSVKCYEFWDGLCSLLRNDPDMQLFLMHLQCQVILMNIHMHLITTPTDCPICNDTIAEYFMKVSVPFNANFCEIQANATSECTVPVVLVCIHPNEFDTKSSNIGNSCTADSNGVYLFDSSICSVSEMKGSIDVVIPRNMIDLDEYSVTVYAYSHYMAMEKFIGLPLTTISLENINIIPYTTHPSIINPDYSLLLNPINPSSSFGKLALMEYTGCQYVVNISLSDKVISDLHDGCKLRSEMITDTSLKIICNTSEFIVEYSTPIDYNNVKIKYSTKRKLTMIEADCKPFDIFSKDQIPLFFVNPDNRIILPLTNVSEFHLQQSAASQFTSEDRKFINKYGRGLKSPPSINAKEVFVDLFQRIDYRYFILISADRIIYGMITVYDRLFDVQYQTPALDLLFYIKEEGIDMDNDPAFHVWMRYATSNVKYIGVNGNEVSLVRKALVQFGNRTRAPKGSVNPLNYSEKNEYFRRVIAYHLSSDVCELLPIEGFSNPPQQLQMTGKDIDRSSTKPAPQLPLMCSRCKSQSDDLKKCTRCRLVAYCGKQCQREDWSEHKLICKQT